MTKPNIAYVDEQLDERANFFQDAYDSGLFDDIHLVEPVQNIEVTIAEIIDLKVDALVSDFNLTDAGPLNYSGEDLIARFLAIRAGFPCFIRTSFEEDALNSSADVNRIYSKDVTADVTSGRSLFNRIVLQVEKHRRQAEAWHSELEKLLSVPDDERSAADIQRIVELDTLVEASIGNDQRIADDVKARLFERRDDLAAETERLINEMKRALGDEV